MRIERIVDGYQVAQSDDLGTLAAQIYRPRPGRPGWALCYASCTGRYREKQGKYESHATRRDALAAVRLYLQI